MIDTNQLRRENRERIRRGLRPLSRAETIQRNAWKAVYRDGSPEDRKRARAALAERSR